MIPTSDSPARRALSGRVARAEALRRRDVNGGGVARSWVGRGVQLAGLAKDS